MKQFRGAGCLILLLTLLMTTLFSACSSLMGAVRETAGAAKVTKYYTYGMFFQLEGYVEDPGDVASAALVLRSGSGEEDTVYRAEVPFSVSKKQGLLKFKSAEKIDEGLCLDTLPTGTCAALLELTDKKGETRTLSLADATGSDKTPAETPVEYYTLSHGWGHRKVTTGFRNFGENSTLVFRVKRSRLPSDVYDIVIDPGHGGKDPGAQSGSYNERDIVLEEAKAIQSALERAGYKVLLTRDGSEDPSVSMAYTLYDKDGRVNMTCSSRAKLSLSIHLNHSPHESQNGVQIYRSRKAGDAFARAIASGLVDGTGLSYSTMGGRTVPGVYTRTFSAAELRQERAKAKAKGFTFYDATTSTDYYFMIREFGGIATDAYVDGRNPDYGTNEYRDSNQGVEGLLCELAFMTNEADLKVLLQDQRGIAGSITDAVDRYVDGLYETPGGQTADLLGKETL